MAKLATYMGFDDLKFVGHDGNFEPNSVVDMNHFDPEYLTCVTKEEVERWNHAHKRLVEWIAKHTT